MGCELASAQMRGPTPAALRGLFSTFNGTPRRCSTSYPSKNIVFYSILFRTSFSAAALRAEEKPNREFNYRRNPEKIRSWREAKEPQSCYSEVSVGRAGGGLESAKMKNKLKRYSGMLRDCAAEIHLRKGKVIHGRIIRSGTEPDEHLWVSLINFYAKCGELGCSRKVLEQMPVKDVVSWTALISGFVARGRGAESLELFCEMRREDVQPNEFTLATVLKGCSLSWDLDFGKQMHAEVVKASLLSDVYIGSSLIDLYSKCGEMEYADDVFCMMPEKNVVLWNTLLNGHAQAGNGDAVLRLFREMEDPDMRFSNYTLSIVLKGIAGSGALEAGRAIHSIVVKVGGELDDFVRCSLLNMYSKCGAAYDSVKVFKTIKNPDIVAWSSIISVVDQQGWPEDAAKLFRLLRNYDERPNEFTLSSIVSAATDLGDLRYGQSIHACAYKFSLESDNSISNALITMYMKLGCTDDGHLVFRKMVNRDVMSWNVLLSGFHDDETSDHGPRFFRQMLTDSFRPNMYTFISILRCCSSLLDIEFGRQVHSRIIKDNLASDSYVGTALIDMYAKCLCMDVAELIFSQLKTKNDAFTWTVVISGYSQTNQGEKAVHWFNRMRREGVVPNEFTLASCLRGCSSVASLDNGRQFHSLSIKVGLSTDVFVSSALVDMYGKCGNIDSAEILFYGTHSRDTVLWNTIICGYAQHGEGDKALQAFTEMIDQVLPDGVTFTGILSACSHKGYVEQGKKFFYSMSESYGVTPTIDHYAILVDILGRAGKFDEVESVIKHMELTPNALIWENVLAACKSHGNVELGEIAAEKLFELAPGTDSNYILLSNLYASKGRWNDVARVRALMTNKGIKKEPGCSWVEADARVHVFLSQDTSHPRLLDIHRKLDELNEKVSEAGYVPDTSYVLHNVTENSKVDNLFGHSERLALGFALINSVGSKRIRIFKNLRICGDCHEFMKLVSGIVDREIVVRDASRFHHFRHGSCSCKDYW